MRFAYIDSNGNEVPIPSVDALALRIELGAITDDTQLFDASADEWAPAKSHEIYNTLRRSSGDDEGFVAPPPVTPPAVAAPSGLEGTDAEADAVAGGPAETTQEDAAPAEAPDPDPEPAEPEDSAGDVSGLTLSDSMADVAPVESAEEVEPALAESGAPDSGDGGLTLADDMVGGGGLTQSDAPAEPAGTNEDDLGFDALDLAPPPGADEPAEPILELAEEERVEEGEASGFDFGAMEGGLELEEPLDGGSGDGMMDFGGGLDTGAPDLGDDGDFGASEEPTPDFSGGMDLETAMEFDAGGFDGGGGGLDLEAPMSDFTPDDPPSWMEGEGAADGDVLDFSSVSGTADDEADPAGARERRTPKNKPSPPKHRRQRNLVGPLVGVVIVLAVGVGGYAAWPILSEQLANGGTGETPAVVLPPLSAELMPQMEVASRAALAGAFRDVVSGWNGSSRVAAPGTDWPGGRYMASASEYGVVQDFWSGMSELLGAARVISLAEFDAAVAEELAAQGITGADADAIRERADSGFVAATPARQEVWDRFAAVVDASLALHQFVVANEAGIEYVPASTATTNPVLEVDAATPEISAALDEMLGAVVDALADLGYRDVVSSEGLRAHLAGQLQATGVQ